VRPITRRAYGSHTAQAALALVMVTRGPSPFNPDTSYTSDPFVPTSMPDEPQKAPGGQRRYNVEVSSSLGAQVDTRVLRSTRQLAVDFQLRREARSGGAKSKHTH